MSQRFLRSAALLDPEAADPLRESILVRDGRIAARLPAGADPPTGAEVVDLADARIAPGFIDLHFHGELVFARGEALRTAVANASRELVRHGTTAFLATSVAWPADVLRDFMTQLASIMTQTHAEGAEPIGVHLEGPWINVEAAGAQPERGIRPFEPSEGRDLLDRGEGCVKMVTLAPEVEGSRELLELLGRRGIVAALGHSRVPEPGYDAAVQQGMTHVTHLFNAMGGTHHREPGVPGLVLSDDRLTCDLICDGAHVHPRMVALAARAKRERLVLITDRVDPPAGPAPGDGAYGEGGLRDEGGTWRLADGRLAGSSLHLDRALRNAQAFGAMGLLEAVAACTLRPARVLGIESQRGTLRAGARADFAVLDAVGAVRETWIGGRRVFPAESTGPG